MVLTPLLNGSELLSLNGIGYQQNRGGKSTCIDALRGPLNEAAEARGKELLAAHRRVRTAARIQGVRYDVRPHLPPDVLGLYVLLPVAG